LREARAPRWNRGAAARKVRARCCNAFAPCCTAALAAVRELRTVCRGLRTIVHGPNTLGQPARNAPERAAVTFSPLARIPD
jgi:hypothetical protein